MVQHYSQTEEQIQKIIISLGEEIYSVTIVISKGIQEKIATSCIDIQLILKQEREQQVFLKNIWLMQQHMKGSRQ